MVAVPSTGPTERRGGLRVTRQQAAVVDHALANAVTVVGAGAGSGKTHATAATVLELLDRGDACIQEFVLITFTNEAADELRERMEALLRERVEQAVAPAEAARWRDQRERLSAAFIGTIHSFCRRILQTYGYESLVAREADVTFSRAELQGAIEDSVEELLREPMPFLLGDHMLWEEFELAERVRDVLEAARNSGLRPQELLARTEAQAEDAGKPYRKAMAWLVARTEERYAERKHARQVLDSNDLLREAADLLSGTGGPRVLDRLARRYRYLFVDEFQDTDEVQKRIVDAFRGRLRSIMVVGDRKQSIYGFRGAVPSLLDRIATENGVEVLPLNVSRRPTRALLRAQNALFSVMGDRYPVLRDPLEPWEGAADVASDIPPLVYVCAVRQDGRSATREDRIERTAAGIRRLLGCPILDRRTGSTRPTEAGDIVVLLRTNRQLQAYAHGLRERLRPNVEVRPETGGRFFRQPEVVATYRMLLLLSNHPDDTALSLALQSPYLREADARAMEQHLLQYGSTEGTPLTDWFAATYPHYEAGLRELRARIRADTVPQLLGRLYEIFGVRSWYEERGDYQAVENLEKLRELARNWFSEEQALTLRQLVSGLRLRILSEQDEAEASTSSGASAERPQHVRVMTIHRAKGLEFPVVVIPEVQAAVDRSNDPELRPSFILSAEDGLDIELPVRGGSTASAGFEPALQRSRDERLAEEMRAFYVAVTRAEHAVVLVGSGSEQPKRPESPWYSWKDEVLRAQPALQRAGARFV